MSHLPSSPSIAPTQKTVDDLLHDGKPRWDAIEFEVLCSRCGYNLCMLPEPRCPECGLTFDWRTVLDASAWRSEFLFEHHWRAHPIRSWLKTVRLSFRPFRFWRSVSIHDRVQPGPLWFLFLTSPVWFIASFNMVGWLLLLVLSIVFRVASPLQAAYSRSTPISSAWLVLVRERRAVSEFLTGFWFSGPLFFIWSLLVLCTLWSALALLCCLRQTLGRCRVRTVQILRVFGYASTPMMILFGALFIIVLSVISVFDRGPSSGDLLWPVVVGGITTLFACPVVFLTAGLKRYLQLPRAPLLAGTAMFVGVLFTVVLVILIDR